jgi:hypothetical protein
MGTKSMSTILDDFFRIFMVLSLTELVENGLVSPLDDFRSVLLGTFDSL